ncbi:SH3 domain-containing protein [Kovacikia minuta CCNUW1]|uniref:SH3 domain-containing protein n=1 Tax=Kovacikia minuta TaxID=2931930 RepID=UPI001CCBBC09|nr:SH3 domain-containing protein [Kovacikia minuta]UBF28908.1 SH3 domain-containing protein [Kovacikia minuta CCNUW1]
MSWSSLLKVLSGFFLAIALIAGGSYFAVQRVIAQFTAPPPRPIFPNDKPAPKAKPVKSSQPSAAAISPSPQPSATPSAAPSPTPSAKPSAKKPESEGYRARIVISEGLNLREGPDRNSNRVGGVEYNDEITILEDSPDKEWQKVRVEGSNVEGWIKSGYAEKLN